jgi:hypothetical protein
MTDAKKKGARPFGWRNVLNWTLAPGVALAVWYMTLDFIFEAPLDLYDAMEDIWYWLPAIFISVTMGLAVGAAQSIALPLQLVEFRRGWFWRTAVGVGTGFMVVILLDEWRGQYDLFYVDNTIEYLRQLVIFTVLAAPLLVLQSHLLHPMQHAYRGTQPSRNALWRRLVWVWWLPNLLFIAMATLPDRDNGGWVALSLVVWGAGMGLTLWWMLRRPDVSVNPTPASSGVQS